MNMRFTVKSYITFKTQDPDSLCQSVAEVHTEEVDCQDLQGFALGMLVVSPLYDVFG